MESKNQAVEDSKQKWVFFHEEWNNDGGDETHEDFVDIHHEKKPKTTYEDDYDDDGH